MKILAFILAIFSHQILAADKALKDWVAALDPLTPGGDELFWVVDDPSGTSVSKNISLDSLGTYLVSGALLPDGSVPMTGALDLGTVGQIDSNVVDSASAVLFDLTGTTTMATVGSKVLSVGDGGGEDFYIDYAGRAYLTSGAAALYFQNSSHYVKKNSNAMEISGLSRGITISDAPNETHKLMAVSSNRTTGESLIQFPNSTTAVTHEITVTQKGANDQIVAEIAITGQHAGSSAVTNDDGGGITITAGDSATATGDGGPITLEPGSGADTEGRVRILQGSDATAIFEIDTSAISTATTRTLTLPDADITLFAPAVGGLAVTQGATSMDNIGDTPIIATFWDEDQSSTSNVTPAHASDYITVSDAGTYHVSGSASFSGTNGATVTVYIYIYDDSGVSWGEANPTCRIERKLANGDVGAMGLPSCLVTLDSSDRVALYITTESATDDVTFTEAQLVLERKY